MEIKGKFEKELEEYSNKMTETKKIGNDLLNHEIKRSLEVIKFFLGSLKNETLNNDSIKELEDLKKVIDKVLEDKKRD